MIAKILRAIKPDAIAIIFKRKDIALFLYCVVIFTLAWPLDIWVASWFYHPDDLFYLEDNGFNLWAKKTFAKIQIYYLVILIIGIILTSIYQWKKSKSACVFFLLVLLIGPGILVNVTLKDNSIGRARPNDTQQFSGPYEFSRAFVYSGECKKNCSFVSGHSAIGFYLIALGWVFSSRRWFWFGFAVGVVLSVTRITMGAHYLSDTVFAFWAVYLTTLLLGYQFGFKSPFEIDKTE